MKFQLNDKTEMFNISAGINDEIIKEEIRDGPFIANIFYPISGEKFKPVVHINGGVPLMQDARKRLTFLESNSEASG